MSGETCSREKFWKELSIEEKIERMRNAVKGIDANLSATRTVLRKIEKHSHQDNKLVIPFEDDHCGGMVGRIRGDKPDEVYF